MFEQQSYEQTTDRIEDAPVAAETELFNNYEIKTWDFNPRIYKIVGAAAVLNILFFTVLAQTNVLTARGCQSPFVGNVCTVLDMAYVGAVLFGTDREVADLAYERTQLEPGDEVTFISMDGVEPQFEYPPGYFKLANPEQFQTDPLTGFDNVNPGFSTNIPQYTPPAPRNDLASRPQRTPKPIKGNPIVGEVKDPWGEETETADNGAKPGSGKPGDGTVADKRKPEQTPVEPVEESQPDRLGVFINKRPLREGADETIAKIDSGVVDLTKSFKASIAGSLGKGKDGKTIVLVKPKPVPSDPNIPNDPAMEKLAQDWILRVGDAGWFGHLYNLNVRNVVITVEQNNDQFVATVRADQPSENDARTVQSGLNTMLNLAKGWTTGDEQMFLSEMETSYEGKIFFVKFEMPKDQVQELIQRKLAESKSKEVKPSGNAGFRPGNATAVK